MKTTIFATNRGQKWPQSTSNEGPALGAVHLGFGGVGELSTVGKRDKMIT